MSSPEGLQISLDKVTYMHGKRLYVTVNEAIKSNTRSLNPKSVHVHEAIHSVLLLKRGGRLRRVSVVPGPGYNGITEGDGIDAVAALGPDEFGCNGTSHDKALAAKTGADLGSAGTIAKQIIEESREEIGAVADKLHSEKTLNGVGVHEVMKSVKNKPIEVALYMKDIQGKEEKKLFKATVDRESNLVTVPITRMDPGQWVNLPQAA